MKHTDNTTIISISGINLDMIPLYEKIAVVCRCGAYCEWINEDGVIIED